MTLRSTAIAFGLTTLVTGAWALAAGEARADPRAVVRGELDSNLREQIMRAIGEVDGAPANRFEARRRARAAAQSTEALLRSEGYYQPVVEDVVEGEDAPIAIIAVTPGRRFVIANPALEWIAPAPEAEVAAALEDAIPLTEGRPGRAVDVIGAEGQLVVELSRRGYADARAEPRRVLVDHAAYTVQPTYHLNAGPLVRLNGVRVETTGRTRPGWVADLAPWDQGDRYSPDSISELERFLQETAVYDSVNVALAPADQTDVEGARPVVVTLVDRPRRILEIGATYSTTEKLGFDFTWSYYNRIGRADTLRFELRSADINSRLGTSLSLPHWRSPGLTLRLGLAVVEEDTDAYRRTALTASGDLERRWNRTSWISYGLGLDAGHYNESRFDPITQAPITLDRDLVILTARGGAYIDGSDDALNPTRGWRISASAQPTAVTGEDTIMFLRLEGQATAYRPLGANARTVVAGRVRIGSILGGGELTVPSDRLFYSGGSGSVRGYEYQGVGPRLPDNKPRGGTALFEASIEVRRDIGHNFGIAAFVDAGSIGFQEIPNLTNTRYGAGLGLRYNLPFGPIRADIATPLNRREGDASFQIYVSIGQAF